MPASGWLAIGVIAGALLVREAPATGSIAIAFLAGGSLAASLAVSRLHLWGRGSASTVARGAAAARWLSLIAIGVLLVAGRSLAVPRAAGPAIPDRLPTGNGPWTATVSTIGAPRAGQQVAVVELDAPPGMRVAGTMPGFPIVVPGDRVTLDGSLRAPPVDDPYGDYLIRIGVQATIRASKVTILLQDGNLTRSVEGLRRGADRALQLAIPEPEAGLASGILVGLRDRVDRDLSAAFTTVGATHVVAISGWNIAIVATSLAAVAGRMARRRRVALTALAIIAYVAFVGPSPSVVRAAAMAGVVMLARELGRPSRAAAAIGWAGAGLLILDPGLVDDVGFQLSALATVGLIAWATPFTERLAGTAPGRPRAWLAESLGVSLAAQLATLPIVVLTFGRLSLVSPLVNLGVVPLVAPAMGAGVVAMAGGLLTMAGLPAAMATVVGLPAWLLFSLMVGVVRAGARLPFASLALAEPWNAIVALMAAAAIAGATVLPRRSSKDGISSRNRPGGAAPPQRSRNAGDQGAARGGRAKPLAWWRTRSGRLVSGALAAAVVALALAVVHRPDGVPRIAVLDVGQGDAILVEGGRGARLLIDGGPDPGRLLVALDEHLPPWDRRIDVVVLSHPHEDHAAGLATLLDRYAVGQVFEPGMFGPGPGYAALNAELIRLGIQRGTLSTGSRLRIDEFSFRVLWPDPGTVPERPSDGGTGINNVSIVLLGEVNGHRVLLAGDIEEQIDPRLLTRGLPTVDLLKVAHHGSRTSSTDAFLAAVRPSLAVISAGRGNPYGHPAPATVARLQTAGARVLRTDQNGTVTVDLGMGPIRVRTTGARAAAGVADGAPVTTGGAALAPTLARTAIAGAAPGPTSGTDIPFLCSIPIARALAGPVVSESAAEPAQPATQRPSEPGRTVVAPDRPTWSADHRWPLRYDAAHELPSPGERPPAAILRTADWPDPRRAARRGPRRTTSRPRRQTGLRRIRNPEDPRTRSGLVRPRR